MSRYLTFLIVCIALLVAAISQTAVAVAFPTIISTFSTSLIATGWVLSINQLASTAAMPLAGKASDVFGRKSTFIFCISLFVAGSFLSALAPNIGLLIFARLIQGFGGGGFFPSAVGLVADAFPESRQRYIGFITSIYSLGSIIGPNLGGWMVDSFGWRSVFWLNVPIGIIIIIASIILFKASTKIQSQIDLLGAGLFAGSLSAFMGSLSSLGNSSSVLNWILVIGLLAISIILMMYFIRHQKKIKDPIIDIQILKQKPFMAANVYNLLYGIGFLGISSLIPLYAVTVYGMSTLESGLVLTSRSIGMMLAAFITSIYLVRWGYRWPIIVGTCLIAASLIFLGLEPTGINILGLVMTGVAILPMVLLLSGLGGGTASPAANNACIELMPHRVSTITGIRGMFRQTGGAISITLITLILHYSNNMSLGFSIIFIALAALLVLSIPIIMVMPRSPGKVSSELIKAE